MDRWIVSSIVAGVISAAIAALITSYDAPAKSVEVEKPVIRYDRNGDRIPRANCERRDLRGHYIGPCY